MTDKKKTKGKVQKKHNLPKLELKGTLEITRSGIGYVLIEDKSGDVLVRPGDFNTALNGDTVIVKIVKENPKNKKKEGRVSQVLQRRQTEFIGFLQMGSSHAFFVPDSDKPIPDFYIPLDKLSGAKHKDKVTARLVKWDKEDKKPVGEIIGVLDVTNENNTAMQDIIAQSGFPLEFPETVLAEAELLSKDINITEASKRKDCRDILTFTIDPFDAKDFDDAISIVKLNRGGYEIGVHIADVSFFVEQDTEIDKEAFKRATSVYLPDRVNPMLPEKISNELCSLRPYEDKCTFSTIFQITAKGEIKKHWIGKTLIHSKHRFTYEDVQSIIEKKEGQYAEEILILNKFAQKMRKERFDNGAINFSSQEVRFLLDVNAVPISVVVKESKESHQLVEEFMLLANKTIAETVTKLSKETKPIPFAYRVHDKPDEKKLLPFIEYAKRYGHIFDYSTPEKIAISFNLMLKEAKGKPEQHVLEQLGIRTMAKAAYTTHNIGHYGLAFKDYCHFTSPIRRYPDLMVHRVVQSILIGKIEHDKKAEEKCKHCSERERAAMECERAANKYKQVEFMRPKLGETFEGVISGVAAFGFWVETIEQKCEGFVPVASLSEYDEFYLVEGEYCLCGKRSGRKFKMGEKVNVRLISANLEKRQLDFQWLIDNSNIEPNKLEKSKTNKGTKKDNPTVRKRKQVKEGVVQDIEKAQPIITTKTKPRVSKLKSENKE